jgi:glycerophosphoryl diester phosphodiesterase
VNPWLERRVIAFAHQGGSFEGPSSTLFAIEHALAVGATAIELDVHATLDRHVVVSHDHAVDRTTNHHGDIAQLRHGEISQMDNAYWWIEGDIATPGQEESAYLHRGQRAKDRRFAVSTLEEVATAFPGVLLNLDIKRSDPDVEPYEKLLYDQLRYLEIADSVIVASFHDEAIQRFRALAPEVATSAATQETAAFYFSHLEDHPVVPPVSAFQVPAKFGDVEVVTESFVEAAHRCDVAVHVWTVNEVDEMTRLLDLGVDGLVSDRPTALATLLAERDCAWNGRLEG